MDGHFGKNSEAVNVRSKIVKPVAGLRGTMLKLGLPGGLELG